MGRTGKAVELHPLFDYVREQSMVNVTMQGGISVHAFV